MQGQLVFDSGRLISFLLFFSLFFGGGDTSSDILKVVAVWWTSWWYESITTFSVNFISDQDVFYGCKFDLKCKLERVANLRGLKFTCDYCSLPLPTWGGRRIHKNLKILAGSKLFYLTRLESGWLYIQFHTVQVAHTYCLPWCLS